MMPASCARQEGQARGHQSTCPEECQDDEPRVVRIFLPLSGGMLIEISPVSQNRYVRQGAENGHQTEVVEVGRGGAAVFSHKREIGCRRPRSADEMD